MTLIFQDHDHCKITFWAIYHTIIRAAFVCVFVCSLSPPWSFDGSSPNLVGVCRWTSELPLRGSFSKRSTGRQVNRSLSLSLYYIYAPGSCHTAAKSTRRMIADDTRLTPHHCKKHTASFARSTVYFLVVIIVLIVFISSP